MRLDLRVFAQGFGRVSAIDRQRGRADHRHIGTHGLGSRQNRIGPAKVHAHAKVIVLLGLPADDSGKMIDDSHIGRHRGQHCVGVSDVQGVERRIRQNRHCGIRAVPQMYLRRGQTLPVGQRQSVLSDPFRQRGTQKAAAACDDDTSGH